MLLWVSLVAQVVKNLPTMQKIWVRFLDWEDPLEKGMATHSNVLTWRIPRIVESGGLQSMGSQRVGHNWAINMLLYWTVNFSADFYCQIPSSVQVSRSVVSNSLQPHESQHARPPCPSPGVHSNSYSSSRWCHLAISSCVVPFSSCPQSLPASGSFPLSQLFTWGGQKL